MANAISNGVRGGVFGLGIIENGTPSAKFFNEQASASFEPGEVLIHKLLCEDKQEQRKRQDSDAKERGQSTKPPQSKSSQSQASTTKQSIGKDLDQLAFRFNVPEGQVNHVGQLLLHIASHYKDLRLRVKASGGNMSKHDVEMIREALRQIGAEHDGLP